MPETSDCSLCGAEIESLTIASTNQLQPSDLDLRPGEMARSTMAHWVIRCPACGFVDKPEGGGAPDGIPDLVRSEEYVRQLADESLPELASTFLCRALIEDHLGRHEMAGWQALRAAWACDDAGSERATACRERVLEHWSRLRAGPKLEDGVAAGLLVMTDVARRAGHFEEAREHCRRALSGRPGEPVRSLLEFETELITRQDRDAHSVSEAIG